MKRKSGRFLVVAGGICAAVAANLVSAADFTWDGGHATSNDWTEAANWNPNGAPADASADIHFAGTSRLSVNVNSPQSIRSIEFEAGSGSFSIAGSQLTIGIGGIANTDDSLQTINAPILLSAAQSWISGTNSASGNLAFGGAINNAGHTLTLDALSISNVASSITINGPISGAGQLVKTGSGIAILAPSAASSYTGPTTVLAGTLALASSNRPISNELTIGDFGGTAPALVRLDASQALAGSNPSIFINRTGTLDLNGRNDSFSFLTLNGGAIAATGGGFIHFADLATVASNQTATIAGSVTVTNSGPVGGQRYTVNDGTAAVDLDVTGQILSGVVNPTLVKLGAGTLRFSGTIGNTNLGTTRINEGTLLLGKTSSALAINGPLTIGDNTGTDIVRLEQNAQIRTNVPVTINSSGLLDLAGKTQEMTNLILVGGDVSAGTGGTIRLSGAFTSSGATRTARVMGGTVDLNGFARPLSVDDGPPADDLEITSVLSNGGITKSGAGTLVLSGDASNTHLLPTTVNAGVLILRKTAGLNAIPGNLVIGDSSGTDIVRLEAANQISDSAAVTINSSGQFQMGSFAESIGSLTMTSGQISADAGTTLGILGNVTTNASPTSATINAALNLGGGLRLFTIADGSASGDLVINNPISNGSINKSGPGALRLNAANDINLHLSSGAVLVGHDQALGTAAVNINGGTLTAEGVARTINNSLAITNGFTVGGSLPMTFTGAATVSSQAAITASAATTFSAAISGAGGLSKLGVSPLTLAGSAANTYTGPTTVNEGTLILSKGAGTNAIAANLVIGDSTGGAASDIVRLGAADQINDAAAITINSSGLLDLAGHSETISALTLNAGRISTSSGTFGLGGDLTSNAAAESSLIEGRLNLLTAGSATRTFTIADGAADVDLDVPAQITGSLTKLGQGTLRLGGNNQLTNLILSGGRLLLASDSATANAPITANAVTIQAQGPRILSSNLTVNGPLLITVPDNSDSLTLDRAIAGAGTITKTGLGTLTFADDTDVSIILNGGTISSASLAVGPSRSFTQNAGTFTGTLALEGTFNYSGGTFSGHLLNEGTVNFNTDFTAGNGITNRSALQISRLTQVNGLGMLNEDVITFADGSLAGGGPIVNNALIEGFGVIGGNGGFTNNGFLLQSGGNWILANSGPSNNAGNIDLAAGRTFRIDNSATLGNTGTINLNGAIVSGGGTLSNSAGGTVAGRGIISSNLANLAGATLVAQGGTLNIPAGFSNAGTVQLTVGGTLGGGTINSSGRIQGAGNVASGIVNAGTIESVGGTLTLNGPVTNSAGGILAAPTGSELRITTGLSTNEGKITLNGGTFDKTGALVNGNGGQVIGYGVFRTGGFTNDGSVLLSGGSTTVEGNVTNNAGKLIHVQYTPALFTGAVINNGIFKNTATTITFAGSYTENGIFQSDPADNFFASVNISEGGAWVGGYGDRFFVSGDLVSTSRNRTGWQTAEAEIRFVGGVDHVLSVMGDDRGATFAGYDDNFAWRVLHLGGGDKITLADVGEPGGALYLRELNLPGGINQISSIQSNGLNIYYHLGGANAYLGGQTYALSGGGTLAPVPEPSVLGFSVLGTLSLLGRRLRKGKPGKHGR